MSQPTFKPKWIHLLVAATLGSSAMAHAAEPEVLVTDDVPVVSNTPLPSLGLPLNKVPANVQVIKEKELVNQKSLTIADHLANNLPGVNINDVQNNPFQPDVMYRGFTASPLLGTPQGLSVFVDGVRVNEPFGDVVNWDLIPMNAIRSIELIPGSNPIFGLNTLGGALSVQTKSGRTNQGGAVEAYTGSFGRRAAGAEYGGVSKDGSVDYFLSANYLTEDGWRDSSPSDIRTVFGKVGWQDEKTQINLSYSGAENDLIGNGYTPGDMLRNLGRETILTKPDRTENTMSFVNLTGSHWFTDTIRMSGNAYYRHAITRTLNGDGNDEWDNPGDETGAINRTKSTRKSAGFTGQLEFNDDFLGRANQFTVGGGFDYGHTTFGQTTELGELTPDRGVIGNGDFEDDDEVSLRGITKTWSLFATNTHNITDKLALTLAARYNNTQVINTDYINEPGSIESVAGRHTFQRLNPSVGLTFTPSKDFTVFGSYSEASRAPTAIELGCANPESPCKLPNSFAGDPPLDQVVSRTVEGGIRGKLTSDVGYSLAAFHTLNKDDILFVTSNAAVPGQGYFDNFGKTRRQGIEASIFGSVERLTWRAGYSFVDATYRSSEQVMSESNSESDADGNITISKGDRIPGIPRHQFKLRTAYQITDKWSIGTNIITFSSQYARGNENNDHEGSGGKIGGYTIVNLDTRYNLGNGWQVFAKANNIFDKEYSTSALLAESMFNAGGQFVGETPGQAFYAPGAPRAGWIGVRWEFGGNNNNSNNN